MPHTSKGKTHLLNANKILRLNERKNASSDDSSFSMDTSDKDEEGANSLNFKNAIQLCDIADIFKLCKKKYNTKYFSVFIWS